MSTILQIQDPSLNTLAYLNKLEEGYISEEINGALTLNFVCDMDLLKTPYLYDTNNFIVYEDDLFRVVEVQELHNTKETVKVSVYCEHYTYDLLNVINETFVFTNVVAAIPMAQALKGTKFSVRKCEPTNKASIAYDEEEINSKKALSSIASNWGGELGYYRNFVDLLTRRGANRGVDFRFKKNMPQIKRTTKPKEGTVAYEVSIEEGTELEELGHFELGDTVRVIDDMLNIDIEVRIVSLKKDIIRNSNSDVILGDKIKDLRSSFSNVQSDLNKVSSSVDKVSDSVSSLESTIDKNATDWNKITQITNDAGEIVLGKINELTQVASKIVNSTGTFKHLDNGLYWQDQPSLAASTFATMWGAQGITFANSKKSDGSWDWQTVTDANGVIATEVTTSCLNAISATILSLVVDDLVGKTITGVTIKGSTFISNTSNSTRSMELSNGSIDFKDSSQGGTLASLSQSKLQLYATDSSNNISIEPKVSSSGTTGIKIIGQGTDDFEFLNSSSQAKITLARSGNIYLNSERDIFISPRDKFRHTYLSGSAEVSENFEVLGDKNSIVPTQHYGTRALYAEECDKAYFGTKGVAETANKECVISLDPMFMETIELNSSYPYIISITPYSDARVWVDSIEDHQFTIKSDKDTKFAYDLKAIRISYGKVYLQEKRKLSNKELKELQEIAIDRMR